FARSIRREPPEAAASGSWRRHGPRLRRGTGGRLRGALLRAVLRGGRAGAGCRVGFDRQRGGERLAWPRAGGPCARSRIGPVAACATQHLKNRGPPALSASRGGR